MGKQWVAAVVAAVMAAGCVTGLEPVDFSGLKGVREARFPAVGKWQRDEEGALINAIPVNADPEAVLQAVNGLGVSSAVVDGFSARDFALKCRLSFVGAGAPSVIFRVVEQDGVIQAMYSLAVFGRGATLWRYRDGHWAPLARRHMLLDEGRPHVLRIEGRGDTITAKLDGDPLFETRDSLVQGVGAVGISGREGPCRFHELRVKSLDKKRAGNEGT